MKLTEGKVSSQRPKLSDVLLASPHNLGSFELSQNRAAERLDASAAKHDQRADEAKARLEELKTQFREAQIAGDHVTIHRLNGEAARCEFEIQTNRQLAETDRRNANLHRAAGR